MEKLRKIELIAAIKNLNTIIEYIDIRNCYDMVTKFYSITSNLLDRKDEIKNLLPPIEGTKFLRIKSRRRKISEINRFYAEKGMNEFFFLLERIPLEHNQRKPGEKVTKEKIYFGDIAGIRKLNIKTLEEAKDTNVQKYIRIQITTFVKGFVHFDTSWLI